VIDLDEGKEVAAVEIESPTGNTPAVVGEKTYFGTESGTFFGVDWQKAEVVWRHDPEQGTSYRSSAAVAEGLVIVGGRNKRLQAFDAATGTVAWEFAAKSGIESSPVIVGQRVFIATTAGRLYAVSLADGEELWQYEAGGGFMGSPAVAERRLVIANDDGVVYCFGRPD
jgi:outer membrane protein assembly factor BamB